MSPTVKLSSSNQKICVFKSNQLLKKMVSNFAKQISNKFMTTKFGWIAFLSSRLQLYNLKFGVCLYKNFANAFTKKYSKNVGKIIPLIHPLV